MFILQKKIAALGLLLLVAIPLFFTVVVLVKQKVIHYFREEKLDTELLQTITVSPEELHWVKPGKEVIINGKLFDVKAFKSEGSIISLSGYFDVKEDKLVQQIKDLVQQKTGSNSPFSYLLVKFLFSQAYTSYSEIIYGGNWKFITQQYYPFDEKIHATPCHSPNPPPWL